MFNDTPAGERSCESINSYVEFSEWHEYVNNNVDVFILNCLYFVQRESKKRKESLSFSKRIVSWKLHNHTKGQLPILAERSSLPMNTRGRLYWKQTIRPHIGKRIAGKRYNLAV